MADIVRRQVCRCVNCGNEAEMVFTCSLPEAQASPAQPNDSAAQREAPAKKARAVGTCSHCGNEADMWVDLQGTDVTKEIAWKRIARSR